jgi:PAS domain S-box-containing protein
LLGQHQFDAASHTWLHLIAGSFFVLLTALSLYLLVRRYATELSCSRELVARVFDASPDGIAVFRVEDQTVMLANHRFLSLFGYPAEALQGRSDKELDLWVHPEERHALLNKLRSEDAVERFESTFRHRSGSRFTGMVTARRINFDGQACTITFIEDTTQQKKIARQVEELTRYDAMTGLPNQQLLTERLDQQLLISSRDGQSLAVITLSLGRCPSTISAMGHNGCDELFRCVAMRLRGSLRETDTLAVLQKGEFGILLPRAVSERDLLHVVNKH